ncbi:glycosyltransferase involved in cell wall biosynthesis [Neorhizobium galegae]|uniref:glycosyltransferase n=1 Tax=Neorhizobium galegae TaxID=399 RepID=UPI001AEAE102|nr:glycosyltransferase [Neorhizobium galegae]MBP2548061.1 glycosyltransferase involved in cell wall biosynthesis [Neorhizobium galegae]
MIQKKKLGILIEVDSFIGDIARHLSDTYEIMAVSPRNMQDIDKVVQWADVVWFEFCNELFLQALNQNIRAMGKRVIVRWHRFEIVESSFPQRLRFDYIDDLILVSHDMLRVLKNRVPTLETKTRTHVLWNGLNLDKFKPIATLDRTKIAWVAKPFLRKNQPMFLQIMHELVKADPSYTLHVAGAQEEFVTMPYLKRTTEKLGLTQHVHFYGWQQNMPAFLADKGVILSTSIHESFGYNIAEAMAVGALPVVHDYPGAEEFWPDAIRFSSIAEAVQLIRSGRTHQWIDYVTEKFPLSKQLQELDAILSPPVKVVESVPLAPQQPWETSASPYLIGPDAGLPAPVAAKPVQHAPLAITAPTVETPRPAQQPAQAPLVFDSSRYWEERYRSGGNSGPGSYDILARYKAVVLNFFTRQRKLKSIAEMGSGDGNQLQYFDFPLYTGFDVSRTAIERTKGMYASKPGYDFIWMDDPSLDWELHEDNYDCALSLDVLYHLVDDRVFEAYLDRLFTLSSRYVVIYASNFDAADKRGASHVRHRKFTDFIDRRYPQWTLKKVIENPYKFKLQTEADFFVYAQDEAEDMSFLDAIRQAELMAQR